MTARFALFFSLFVAGCSSSSGGAITDAGTDGTADVGGDVTSDAPIDTASCVDCIGIHLSWGSVGGLVAYTDSSSVDHCNQFTYTRTHADFDAGGPQSCTTTVAGCSATSGIGLAQLEAALADPDVTNGFAHAPILYGRDTRPSDGAVFEITSDGKRIDVGLDCAGAPGCTAVPPGVAALQTLLQNLSTQELGKEACVAVFGHPGGP